MKKFLLLMLALVATSAAMAQDSWTVAGTSAILNGTASWAPSNTENDMTSTDGVNYTLTVTGKTLEANTTYEYKVVKNHAWGEEYPSSNATLSVAETAVYTIAYSFNAETKAVSAEATKTGEAGEVTHTYSIAGNNATLFGASWSAENTATDMTKNDNGIYVWTKNEVELTAGTIEYKVVQDHSWGVSFGANGGNATVAVPMDGKYNATFTFNEATKEVGATLEALDAPEANYFMKHPWAGGEWSWKALEKDEESGLYYVQAQYGGNGVNVNTAADDANSTWIAEPQLEGDPQTGDDCVFYYNPTTGAVLIKKGVVTAISDITVGAAKTYKTIENGQVIIVKDNVRYNIMGVKL